MYGSQHSRISMLATLLFAASSLIAATAPDSHPAPHKAVKHSAHRATHHYSKRTRGRKRGQQAIDSERARQIQQALVRAHYLKGAPSGSWDTATQEAMRRYQADQGWQTKEVPDSRALIRLGLGPDNNHLLNPESAMTSDPQLPHGSAAAHPAASSDAGSSETLPNTAPASAPATSAPDLSPSR